MKTKTNNALVILGPTASGKTRLGAQLAALLQGEIVSADSRQVYKELTIGSGKDLNEYQVNGQPVPYHLIDIADLSREFSIFDYQRAFYPVFEEIRQRHRIPVIVGGSGLYLESVLRGYALVNTPEDPVLRNALELMDDEVLRERLMTIKPDLHNTTDLQDRARMVRAIEIAEYAQKHPMPPVPEIRPLLLGIAIPPGLLRIRISARLKERMASGLIEEVEMLHARGHHWERLERLGLEYRYIAEYLQGKIKNKNDLFQKLNGAIAQFAKRQRTWFRRMERQGFVIHWIPAPEQGLALQAIRQAQSDTE